MSPYASEDRSSRARADVGVRERRTRADGGRGCRDAARWCGGAPPRAERLPTWKAAQAEAPRRLHWAAYHGRRELGVAAARKQAPTLRRRTANGSTPLWLAASQGDAPMIEAADEERRGCQ